MDVHDGHSDSGGFGNRLGGDTEWGQDQRPARRRGQHDACPLDLYPGFTGAGVAPHGDATAGDRPRDDVALKVEQQRRHILRPTVDAAGRCNPAFGCEEFGVGGHTPLRRWAMTAGWCEISHPPATTTTVHTATAYGPTMPSPM